MSCGVRDGGAVPSPGPAPCRFALSFVVVGMDPDTGLEPDGPAGEGLEESPIQRSFRSKVLARYPDSSDRGPFNRDALNMLCMPTGLSFCTQTDSRVPRFHSFSVARDDGSRCYGFAQTYFEEVPSGQITAAMHTLHQMHHVEHHHTSSSPSSSSSSSPSSSSSSSPSSSSMDSLASSMDESDADSLVGGVAYPGDVACPGCASSYDQTRDILYVSKSLCLLTPLPFLQASRHFLSQMHQAVASPLAPPLPLESYVHNILYEVPVPMSGRSLRFHGPQGPIVVQRPAAEELPLGEFSLGESFSLLGVDNLLTLLTCTLLETQILLYSRDLQRLTAVAEGVTTLLFPFRWQHVYLPILPSALRHLLDAPVPYILGLQPADAQPSHLHLPHQANLCFVDIDCGRVDAPKGLPSFPDHALLAQELSQLLLQAGFLPQGGTTTAPPISPPPPTAPPRVLEDLVEDCRNGNLGGEELAVLERLQALARRHGYSGGGGGGGRSLGQVLEEEEVELLASKLSVQLREVIASWFLAMFGRYEEFVISSAVELETWTRDRETAGSFHKVSFLAAQPVPHRPFLSRFLETTMFSCFIAGKVMSRWGPADPMQLLFDQRLERECLDHLGHQDPCRPGYRKCTTLHQAAQALERRMLKVDHTAIHPHLLDMRIGQGLHQPGRFPTLQADVLLAQRLHSNRWSSRGTAPRRIDPKRSVTSDNLLENDQKHTMPGGRSLCQSSLLDSAPTAISQTQRGFVDALLRECRQKTKRMLTERMGHQGVDQGEASITGLQENTLILGLWELLERTWGHGLLQGQGKSSLWSHLLHYQTSQEQTAVSSGLDQGSLMEGEGLLGNSFLQDMRVVQTVGTGGSEVSQARLWVHLALEKKVLSHHLKQLLTNQDLVRQLYAPHAFLLSEEEREQFLFHLLSLNTVEYHCFTRSYPNTDIPYRVVIMPMKKLSIAMTTVTPWVCVSGELGDSGVRQIPRNTQEIHFQCKNLGRLSSLQLGQEKSGLLSGCLLECVMVYNLVTGHAYRFPCGRWLGKGVGDGSLERVLIGQMVSPGGQEDSGSGAGTPSELGSPPESSHTGLGILGTLGGRNVSGMTSVDVQEDMREAVNNLVKHFHKPETERAGLTGLLCGEVGLVDSLQHFLLHGLKTNRLFQRTVFVWDFVEKAVVTMETSDGMGDLQGSVVRCDSLCRYANAINTSPRNIGKEGKFQLLVCLGLRDRLLAQWLPLLADCPLAERMYEEGALLRDRPAVQALARLLHTLQDFTVNLETALVKGVEL